MSDHLKNLSQVYLEQIAESGVGYEPGKPATKLGAVTGIPKADQMAAAERIKKKTAEKKAALEKKHGKKMDDHPEYPNKKYVDEADMSGAPSIKDAKPAKKTTVKYDPHMKVMAPQVEKEEVEQVDENRRAEFVLLVVTRMIPRSKLILPRQVLLAYLAVSKIL